jgi:hypothetical protein
MWTFCPVETSCKETRINADFRISLRPGERAEQFAGFAQSVQYYMSKRNAAISAEIWGIQRFDFARIGGREACCKMQHWNAATEVPTTRNFRSIGDERCGPVL